MLGAAAPRALMASPLTVKGRMAGVIEIASRKERRFTAEEESLLVLMADRAGLAIEHARAYEREVGTVEMLQRSLLPDKLPLLPGLRIAARYRPGAAGVNVGGDWYDAIPLDDGRVGLAMGDVVGHGLGAAALMGQLRYAARAYALEGHPPPAVLDRLDRLVRSLPGAQMATLLYLVVEPDLTTVRFASAGHVPPLVVGPDADARFLEGTPNPPLGVFDSSGHRGADRGPRARLDDRAVHRRVGGGARRVDRRGPGGTPPGRPAPRRPRGPLRPPGRLDARHPSRPRRHRRARASGAPGADGAAAPRGLHRPDAACAKCAVTSPAGCAAAAPSEEDVQVTQMACHEACANAIEHAYGFGEGSFTIDGRMENGKVVLEVSDGGEWIDRTDGGGLPHRGRGLHWWRR